MEGLTTEPCKVDAYIVKDIVSSAFTIYTGDAGGPIISGNSIEEAKLKIENALKLSHAVRNLNFYTRFHSSTD